MQDGQLLYQSAAELFECRSFREAEELLDIVVNMHPTHADAWELKGLTHRVQNDFPGCVHALTKAEELTTLRPIAHCAMGDCLAWSGQRELARQRYLAAYDAPDSGAAVLSGIADGFAFLQEWELCTTVCLEWLNREPKNATAWYTLAVSVAQEGELEEFETLALQALALADHTVAFQVQFAILAENLQQPQMAARFVADLQRADIEAIRCRCSLQGLLQVLKTQGDHERAHWCQRLLEQT